ncbi:MAG: ABC transporter substrate-binding protein [bacterium]
MKSVKALLVCLICLLTLFCSRDVKRREMVLTVWETYNSEERAVFLSLVEEYQKAHPDVRIESVSIPFGGLEPKILTALATQTVPDIARVDVAFLPQLALRGGLCALDTLGIEEIKNELRPVALNSCQLGDRIYGVPEQVNGLCLFYNKDLFKEAGLDPDRPPETWDEFIDYAKKLTNRQKNVFGFGMRNSLWWTLPFIYSFGGDILTPDLDECALASEQSIAGFQLKVDLYAKHGIEGGAWRAGAIQDDMGFQGRIYAMIFNGPWAVKGLEKSGIDFGVGLIPKGPSGYATNVGGNNMVIFRTCKYPQQAAEFLMFLVSKGSQAKWANSLGQIPVNMLADELIDFDKHPFLRTFMEQMKYARARPQIGSYPEIENEVNPEMQAALDGRKSVKEALEQACRKIEKILAEEKKMLEAIGE